MNCRIFEDKYFLSLAPHPSHLIPLPSPLIPHTLSLTPRTLSLTPYPSPLAPHPSHLIPHPSPLSPHTLSLTPRPQPLLPQYVLLRKLNVTSFVRLWRKKVEVFGKKMFYSSKLKKFSIRIRISMKSGIQIRIKTFWIRHTVFTVHRNAKEQQHITSTNNACWVGQCPRADNFILKYIFFGQEKRRRIAVISTL